MVDLKKIEADIEALKTLNAEEYCKEEVAKIYADFEASREAKIQKLENALAVYSEYDIVEPSTEEVIEENIATENVFEEQI